MLLGGKTMDKTQHVLNMMIDYNAPDLKRINHALKVYGFAKYIASGEKLSEFENQIIESSAILHDIGIHEAEKRFNSSAGIYQEKLGPEIAVPILEKSGFKNEEIEKITYIIAHHHTYNIKDNKLLRIIIEADLIVNIDEGEFGPDVDLEHIKNENFVTESGKSLFDKLILNK